MIAYIVDDKYLLTTMRQGLNSIVESVNVYASEHGEYLTIRTIADNGWLIGAKYNSIRKLVESGQLKSFTLDLQSEKRKPIMKIHYKDLVSYLEESYTN